MSKTLIRFTCINRKTRVTRPCWVAGARFADGDGVKVKSVTTTCDREKAARWSTATAYAIALQYCTSPAMLELADGTPLVEESLQLLAEQKRRVDESAVLNAQFRADLDALSVILKALK